MTTTAIHVHDDPAVPEGGAAPKAPEEAEFFGTADLQGQLRKRSVQGGAITLGAQAAKFTLKLGSVALLARLLTPNDFGLLAMVTVVTGFVGMFKDAGLSMATVQRDKITHEQVSTLFWINVALSIVLLCVVAALAPSVAWFYGDRRLTGITLALAGTFLCSGLAVQHQALLRRQMRFASLAAIEVASQGAGIAAGITAALLGARYWALVTMLAVSAAANAVLVWIFCGWRPGLPRRRAGVRSMLCFGGNLTGFVFLNYFARNLDNILIGRVWGATSLGLYCRAYGLLTLPLSQVNAPVAAVAIPTLSTLQNDPQRFRGYYLRGLLVLTSLTTPLFVLCIILCDEFVALLLGPQWTSAGAIFRFLAIGSLAQPICNTSGWLYVATGRTRDMLKWSSLGVTLIVASFFVGLPWGPRGVACSYSCAMLAWLGPCMYFASRATCIAIGDIFRTVAQPAVCGAISAAAVMVVLHLAGDSAGSLARIALAVPAMVAFYLGTGFVLFDHKDLFLLVFRSVRQPSA